MNELMIYNGERLEGLYIKNDMLDNGWKVLREDKLSETQYQIIFLRKKEAKDEQR